MMDKVSILEKKYHSKITAYLDGALSSEERSEFEAFVSTHPEFKQQIRIKEEELETIRSLIPAIDLAPDTLESMNHEIKQSVFNLLQVRSENLWEKLKNRYEEWSNR